MKWTNLRRATQEDGDFLAELLLDQVPLTDHVEWTVWTQRLKPNTNYSKNFGWFHTPEEAEDMFNFILTHNAEWKEVSPQGLR